MTKYSHFDIVQYFRKIFEDEEKRVYNDLKEIPEFKEKLKINEDVIDLPLDLVYIENKTEKNENDEDEIFSYYTLFLIVSTENISESIEKRILFYKFYLSKIISPRRLKIVLIISNIIKLDEEKRKFYEKNGIGVYIFKGNEEHDKEIIPITLREQMTRDFEKDRGKIILENIPLFFDTYVHDAVDSIGGIRPEEFGYRYIDKKLMYGSLGLNKVSYYDDLYKHINAQLTEKGNEHIFVNKIFDRLWEKYIGISYTKFLKSFEPALQNIFAEEKKDYRDHYLHQFQVFLLGLIILYNAYGKENNKELEIKWLITSSFHDFAYPIQLYDIWSGKFFKNALNLENSPAILELKSHFVENFLYWSGLMADSLLATCKQDEKKWKDKDAYIKFFHKKMIDGKNHGVISGISLLTMVKDFRYKIERKLGTNFLEDIFAPCALSIAIHDDNVWAELKNGKLSEGLKFEDDPISFLLIFCDNIQEWGRPSNNDKYERYIEMKFCLEKFEFNEKEVQITMNAPELDKDEEIFIKKLDDLIKLEKFLRSSTVRFAICLKDKNGFDYNFYIGPNEGE